MKRTAWILLCAVFMIGWAAGPVAADQVVQIPYAVKTGGWSTGVAITSLSNMQIEDLTLDIVKETGDQHSYLTQYRTNMGNLTAYAMMVGFLETLYAKTLPDDRFWCEIWHSGAEKFAVTVFVMNVTTGQAEGFGFYPFFSTSKSHTFSEYTPPGVVMGIDVE
ncbi:MAG TPA: hypothetical protein PKY58_07825 [Syntrophales bacterium]|nr:hypothetical protein [Syntrophales bacterium]HPX11203.1 hypothetical protein [Syntrophales bacterium]HQB30999.1 hypothetical protein [Syntrophales bacterium]HQN78534.1 hypothetical protein [Syntrophales bacterium]HQQ27420.1 hypothetical protein [Syntrophales bacterium]